MVKRDLGLAKELFEGCTPEDMTHLDGVSSYNSNYYQINGYLLYGKSDDDNFTEWYWIIGGVGVAIGGSYCTDNDSIIVGQCFT